MKEMRGMDKVKPLSQMVTHMKERMKMERDMGMAHTGNICIDKSNKEVK